MKALVWEAPRVMALREKEIPVIASDEVLLQVAYAGICGSELSGYLGQNALRVPPLVMGHEFSGTITDIGKGARAEFPNLKVGQAVTANPLWYRCNSLSRGLEMNFQNS
jgi:threonine dehydrogenase-like Zn-dependent dehydrogenase